MIVLRLTLKKKWFDMVASGEKREEYRDIKPYWEKRLMFRDEFVGMNGMEFKQFDAVKFTNGYNKDAPTVTVKIIGMGISFGNHSWGAEPDTQYFVIQLGEIIS